MARLIKKLGSGWIITGATKKSSPVFHLESDARLAIKMKHIPQGLIFVSKESDIEPLKKMGWHPIMRKKWHT